MKREEESKIEIKGEREVTRMVGRRGRKEKRKTDFKRPK